MPSELSIVDGSAEMAYRKSGGTPWHNLGTGLPDSATVDDFKEKVDFPLQGFPVTVDGVMLEDYKAVKRMDTGEVLSIRGSGYEIVPNSDLFRPLDPLFKEGHLQPETCGVIRGGRVAWLLAKFQEGSRIRGEEMQDYLMILNSHDGTYSLRADLTKVRAVCKNTIILALASSKRNGGNLFKLRHTASVHAKLVDGIKALEVYREESMRVSELFETFAQVEISQDRARALYEKLQPSTGDKVQTRAENIREKLFELFEHGKGNQGRDLWDWLNGATEYADFHMPHRGKGNGDAKLVSLLSGGASNLKARALSIATETAKAA